MLEKERGQNRQEVGSYAGITEDDDADADAAGASTAEDMAASSVTS